MKKKYGAYALFISVVVLVSLIIWHHYNNVKNLQQQPLVVAPNSKILAPAIIDSTNDITRIPAAQSGVLKKIHVIVGQKVRKGELLFSLDNNLIKNTLRINELTLQKTKHDILIKERQLKFLINQLRRMESLDRRAISNAEILSKKNEIKLAKIAIKQANYNKLSTEAEMRQTKLILDLLAVRAPKDGIILQVNAHPNEFVNTGQVVIFLGDAKKIIVRVSIDEREAHRFNPKAEAYLLTYTNGVTNIPLQFIQLDQYIVTQERLNSRVQEVLYSLDRDAYPYLVAGQLYDVSIELSPMS